MKLNEVRIIAGQWKSRLIRFPDELGLRPTGNRIRETLFNWIAGDVIGARCWDLFGGSGALGFEAASRGAESVLITEKSPKVVAALQASKELLGASMVKVLEWSVPQEPLPQPHDFDIVFVDPPFAQHAVFDSLEYLLIHGYVSSGGLVFLEVPRDEDFSPTEAWEVLQDKTAGMVRYMLLRTR